MRTIPLTLTLALGCAAPEGDLDPAELFPSAHSSVSAELPPPPYTMTLTIGHIRAGAPFEVEITGAAPGAQVYLARSSAGAGVSPPIAGLGGLTLDLPPPIERFGPFTADASGVVTLNPQGLPASAGGVTYGFQAAAPQGAASYLSNRVVKTVAEAAIPHDVDGDGLQRYPWGIDRDDDGDGAVSFLLGGADHDDADAGVLGSAGTGIFTAEQTFSMAPQEIPTGVALGDFDDDGILDVVTSSQDSDSTSVYPGIGNGRFSSPHVKGIAGGGDVAVGDFNEDGLLDYVAAAPLGIFLNRGGFQFRLIAPVFGRASAGMDTQVLDFNDDGHLDVGSFNHGSDLTVILGLGDGTFTGPHETTLSGTYAGEFGDFDLDGFADVAVGRSVAREVGILLGDGTGAFSPTATLHTTIEPWALGRADFNEDGAPDLVVGAAFDDGVEVWMNDGAGNFARTAILSGFADQFVTGDFNGDGDTDFLATSHTGGTWLSLGAGDGTFSGLVQTAYNSLAYRLATGDLNGDGILDQVAVDADNSELGISLGR
jgi:hypothetical protein